MLRFTGLQRVGHDRATDLMVAQILWLGFLVKWDLILYLAIGQGYELALLNK